MHSLSMCHGGCEYRAAGNHHDVQADSAAIVAKVLCNIKEKELEAMLCEVVAPSLSDTLASGDCARCAPDLVLK